MNDLADFEDLVNNLRKGFNLTVGPYTPKIFD